jgi:NADH-quinone oxidoreductase subunit L
MISKSIAYSTVSQLGLMFLALGLGFTSGFSYGHPYILQGITFPGAGSVIHTLHHEQDLRKMGT